MPYKPKAVMFPLSVLLVASSLSACRSVQSASFARAGGAYSDEPTRQTTPPSAVGGENGVDTESTATDTASRWPARWGDDPEHRGIIIDMDPGEALMPIHFSRYHQGRATPQDYDDAAKLASAMGMKDGFKFKAEGPGSFIFMPDTRKGQAPTDPPDLAFRFVSAQLIPSDEPATQEPQDHIALQRTWFTYRDPVAAGADATSSAPAPPPDQAPVLGTVVLMPGLFGTPEPIVDAAERYWHHRGYGVLRMLSQPSHFTGHLRLPVLAGVEQIEDSVASRAARVSDDRVAECAYAVSAALDHTLALRPKMEGKPVILVGMSGGAMSLPTVYAYRPDRYDAAVLIAGGANFMRIMIESNYRDWIDALVIDFDPTDPATIGMPTAEQLDALSDKYLARSRLDAYHTATEMSGIPVLMLQGNSDKAVPTATGNTLYQRLSKPERWTYPVGHELIFMGLPTQIPRIDRWLTEHVLGPQTASHEPDAVTTP